MTSTDPLAGRRTEIEAVFDAALDVDPARRPAWLVERCADDAALLHEVEAMLASLDRRDPWLDSGTTPFARLVTALLPEPAVPRAIGPYRLVREIGRGGMGAVFLAERTDGVFHRRVAIKLLLPGAEATALHQRFLAERQILASLSHPNIAQLLDGGLAPDGSPYLVMEYVDGVSITEYCARGELDVAARLRLFQEVCGAVHHAHRNLVLHRDIKPGNILVSTDGHVKLLDFGIAKLLHEGQQHTGEHPVTRTGGRLMTPAYASPEQMRGGSPVLTTASDVYALGMVLYELLAGVRAYQVEAVDPHEAFALVCEREPERPSARNPRVARDLAGDLDAIVMMALRKEPNARYASADQLSADIGRYLEGLPVVAHRGSGTYRLGRLVRRHRMAVATGAVLAFTLLAGTTFALRQAQVAERERLRAAEALDRSEVARRQADVVTQYLISMFETADRAANVRDSASMDQLLRRGLARAEGLGNDPGAQAQMFDALSRVYQSMGDFTMAASVMQRAVAILDRRGQALDSTATAAFERLAELRRITGEYAVAELLAQRALEGRRAWGGPDHPEVSASYRQLAGLAIYRGRSAAAESMAVEAVRVLQRGPPRQDSLLATALGTLANIRWRRGRMVEAARDIEEAEQVAARYAPAPSAFHAAYRMRVAEIIDDIPSRRMEADGVARSAVAEFEAALGREHLSMANALTEATRVIVPSRPSEREELLRRALAIQRAALGVGDPSVLPTLVFLARELHVGGRLDEAEGLAREAVRVSLAAFGPRHSQTAAMLGYHADVLLSRGRVDSAEVLVRRAIAIRTATFGDTATITQLTTIGLGRVLAARGELDRADSIYTEVRRAIRRTTSEGHPDFVLVDTAQASLRARMGRR